MQDEWYHLFFTVTAVKILKYFFEETSILLNCLEKERDIQILYVGRVFPYNCQSVGYRKYQNISTSEKYQKTSVWTFADGTQSQPQPHNGRQPRALQRKHGPLAPRFVTETSLEYKL